MPDTRDRIVSLARRNKTKCANFLRELIAIPSLSRQEEQIALRVRKHMLELGYDFATIDRFGNVVGRFGNGPVKIVLDAHMDTIDIGDRANWRFDPYRGDMKASKVYGHGATNNKAGLAAIVYAGAIINELDLAQDCTVYIIGSIQAEECDGLAYKALFDIEKLHPNFVVLSMPTKLKIYCGHRGRVEMRVSLRGQTAHAAEPQKGSNCIYGIAKVVSGIEELNKTLPKNDLIGDATIAVTHIEVDDNGSNALPEQCQIIIDRRLTIGEKTEDAVAQVKALCKDIKAKVEVIDYDEESYRGLRVPMEKHFPTWSIAEDHPFVEAVGRAYTSITRKEPEVGYWVRSTAGAYTMGVAGVPTIGFGPSEESVATPTNDHCRIDELEKSMAVYAHLINYLPEPEVTTPTKRRR